MRTRSGDDLGLALSLVLRSYLDAAGALFDAVPAGVRGYHVLAAAAHHAPPTQAALSQQLGIDRSVLTYLLDDLEAARLLERRLDPADRRARRIVVTRSGNALLDRLGRRLREAEQHALRGLAPEDQATARDLLWRAATACAGSADPAALCAVAADPLSGPPRP